MNEPIFLGIDGGGSKLRIAIVTAKLIELASWTAGSANPNIIGHSKARAQVQRGILEALRLAGLQHESVAAVGIGIAGASNLHSQRWLLETVQPLLPKSFPAPSSDLEIALVGALAQRHGLLLLAGTGSAVYGAAANGMGLQIGGWGYLLGDEGSSYWIGSQLLRHITRESDSGSDCCMTALSRGCMDELGLSEPRELVAWLYRSEEAPVARVASLAPFVLSHAEAGDAAALEILRYAAIHLARQVETMRRRLHYAEAPIAFGGGLLDNANWLSEELARRLNLPERPIAKYPPVIGAAMLAKMEWSAANNR